MSITRFVAAPSLEMYFVDKDTGLPLSNGVVTFYKDNDRLVLKDVYQLTGSPPYSIDSFVPLPNPLTLSAYGTIMNEDGNDVIPYYFPYVGSPGDTTNEIELYYITVESEGGVDQFTREAWPPNMGPGGGNVTSNDIYNYIPNGQFLAHTNISESSEGEPDGILTAPVTPIAQGGWNFYQDETTNSVNKVLFVQETSFVEDQPTANPRYSAEIICSTADGTDTVKDLRIKFPNVNKFGSADETDVYTFSVTGKTTNLFSALNVYLVKNYGSGGDTQTEEVIGTVSFDTFYQIQNIVFTFGSNSGKVIGTLNDDYVEIAIRFPFNTTFDVTVTDFVLTHGNVDIIAFPQQTNADMLARGVAGWMPTPAQDGSDLYLPLVLTKEGMTFDHSQIGDIVAKTNVTEFDGSISETGNELLAYGDTYKTSAYSPLGIPYYRYQEKLYDATKKAPIYGTGPDFVDTYVNTTVTSAIRISTNLAGAATAAADVSSTITFSNIHTGADYDVSVGVIGSSSIMVIDDGYGAVASNAAAGTSGFTITVISNSNALTKYAFQISNIGAASSIATGGVAKYFTFTTSIGGSYYVWMQVTTETDPAPGGTGIKVKLTSTDDATEVTRILRESIAGFQVTKGVVPAASAIPAGSYFTFSSPSENYLGWFKKSGSGSDPDVVGKISIEIDIDTSDTASQVADKIRVALNSEYFSTPNLKGYFLRGIDTDSNIDPGVRFGMLSSSFGPELGTFEWDEFSAHIHPGSSSSVTLGLDQKNDPGTQGLIIPNVPSHSNTTLGVTISIASEGQAENRPRNMGVIWAVKY